MATYNALIKKRNASNTGWDSILPITTAENVLINEQGDTVATHMADNAAHGISHKNLLYNWDFRNPLNQRGFTSTTNAGYTIDGWRLAASGHTVEVVSDGIKITASSSAGLNLCFQQFIENYENFEGKTLTLSAHIVENTLTQGCNLRWNDHGGPVIMGTGYFSHTFTPSSLSYIGVQFANRDVDDGKYVIIDKMKLEIGNVSTLANDPPADYGAVAVNTVQANLDTHKAENATTSIKGHVNHGVFMLTITTPWNGTSAPFTKKQILTGILATDTPIVDVIMSGTYATDEARQEAWSNIYRITTEDNYITLYAKEKPTVNLPIQLKVVR